MSDVAALLVTIISQDLLDLLWRQVPEILIVYHDHGREKASPETRDGLKVEHHIFRGLALGYAQGPFDRAQHAASALDVTRGSVTTPDCVLAARLGVKLGVECDDSVDSS